MKIKSIIETANSRYVVLDDVDTIFNKMNDPYFFSDTLFSKTQKNDFPLFGRVLADVESNNLFKNLDGEPAYIIGHMPVIFNTSKIVTVYPMDRVISGVDK